MSEHEHAKALKEWWDTQAPMWRLEPDDLAHIPNGGQRTAKAGAKLKAEGVRAGMPDYILTVPHMCSHGLFIELKTPKGTTTKSQDGQLARLERRGYATAVCHGWDAARQAICDYLGKS